MDIGVSALQIAAAAAFMSMGSTEPATAQSEQAQPDPAPADRVLLLEQAVLDTEALNARSLGHPFRWEGDDGSKLVLSGQIQFRYANNLRRGETDNYAGGFDHRRTRLNAIGKAPGGKLGYVIITQFSSTNGIDGILDAYLTLDLGHGWQARAGTQLLPFDREFLVSNKKRLSNDLSLVGQAVGANLRTGRADGVQLGFKSDRWQWRTMISGGANSSFSPALGTGANAAADIALTSRVDWVAFGDMADFADEAAFEDTTGGLKLGLALHAETREVDSDNDLGFDDRVNDFRWTADVVFEQPFGAGDQFDGVFASLAAFGRHQSIESVDNEERFGLVAQVGKNVDRDTQLFTRYEWATDDDGGADFSQITLGWTEFFMGNSFRLTTELLYAFEPVTANFASPVRDILVDAPNERGQSGIRTQIQLVF